MNSDRIEGTAKDVAGKVQEGVGNIIGDSGHQAEGIARQFAGKAQEVYGDARDYSREAAQQVGKVVEQQPLTSLLIVGAIGFALGLLTASSSSRH